MYLRKKLYAAAAVLILAAALLFGTKQEIFVPEVITPETEATDSEDMPWYSADRETIYFWYNDATLTDFVNSAAVAYGNSSNVRVIPVLKEEVDYIEDVYDASIHSDHIPDVFLTVNNNLEKAYLCGVAGKLPEGDAVVNHKNFPMTALNAVTYKDKYVGYPLYYETTAFVYNKTYLIDWAKQQINDEIAGLTDDVDSYWNGREAEYEQKINAVLDASLPSSIINIFDSSDKITPDAKVKGILSWAATDIFYNYWYVGAYLNIGGENGDSISEMSFNTDLLGGCLNSYQSMLQFFAIDLENIDYEDIVEDFLDGRYIYTVASTEIIKKLEEAQLDGRFNYDYSVAVMPSIDGFAQTRPLSVTGCVCVNTFSEHSKAAKDFAEFVTDSYSKNLYRLSGKAPARYGLSDGNDGLMAFMENYEKSISVPKIMNTTSWWIQLEMVFQRVASGEDSEVCINDFINEMLRYKEGDTLLSSVSLK